MEVRGQPVLHCDQCKEEGNHDTAVHGFCENCCHFLCAECYRLHRRPKPWRNHRLLDRAAMPKERPEGDFKDECMEPCLKHPMKTIEYHCHTHTKLGCSECMIREHQTCRIDYIPQIASNSPQITDYQSFIAHVDHLRDMVDATFVKANEYRSCSKKPGKNVVQDIKKFRKKLDAYLDGLENELTETAKKILDEKEVDYSVSVLPKVKELKSDLYELSKDFTKKLEKRKYCSLFVLVNQNQNLKNDVCATLKSTNQKLNKHSYTFLPSSIFTSLFQDQSVTLGSIHRVNEFTETVGTDSEKHNPEIDSFASRKSCQVITLSPGDQNTCSVSGMTVLPNGHLALCDLANSCVKVLDIEGDQMTSRLELPSPPYGITFTGVELAVTQPRKGQLCILSLYDPLQVTKVMSIGSECRGIAYHNQKFVVSYNRSPGCVKILDENAKTLNTFLGAGSSNFSHPCQLAFNPVSEIVYISDWVKKEITSMSMNGDFIAKLNDDSLMDLKGLTVSFDDSVFYCDGVHNKIQVADHNLTRSVLCLGENEGIHRPQAILYSNEGHKLYVAMGDVVKVFWIFPFSCS